MKKLEEITLGEWIAFNASVSHLYKQNTKDENIIANIFLQKWLFFNKDKKFEDLSEEDIKNAIIECSQWELLLNDEIFSVEYSTDEDILFNDELWNIVPQEINDGIEGFQRVQQLALILSDLQEGKVEALPELCCFYLVRLWDGGGEKKLSIELAKELPLPIVFKVKKYVSDCIEVYNLLNAQGK